MKKFVILKLDTPCTLIKSAMRVPTAEPINFAKALIEANPDETVDVCLLGHEAKQMEHGMNGTIRTVPYFGEPRSIKDEFDDDTKVILWQGRHIFGVSMPSTPTELGARPALVSPYSAGDYERLCMVKIWQVQMYNLMSSNVIPTNCQKFFLVTDLRLPLIELNKVDSIAVPKPLPKGIVLLTQAFHHEEYNKWQEKFGNGMNYPETDLTAYTYKFDKSMYLPLHVLPYWSHRQFVKGYADKTGISIFQTQSIKYMDDYRKSRLGKALKFVNGKCSLHGRFLPAERGIITANYPDYAESIFERLIDNSNRPSECFFDSAQVLSTYQTSLIVTDERYARFGLVPNRFIEAMSVHTIPLAVKGVFDYCDDIVKHCVADLDICPSKTDILSNVCTRCTDGDVSIRNSTGKTIDNDKLEQKFDIWLETMKTDLLSKLNQFSNLC